MLIDILIFIAVLVVLVLVHEFGHFAAAKKFNMYVEEFGFGFPPRLFSWKKNETVWSVNAVPLGGFVKIAGEDGNNGEKDGGGVAILKETVVRENEDVHQEREVVMVADDISDIPPHRFFSSKPIWQRAAVLFAGVVMNFLLGWLMLSGVMMIGAERSLIISQVSSDSPAKIAGIREGDKIIGFSEMDGFISYVNSKKGEEITLTIERGSERKEISLTPRIETPEGQGALGVLLLLGGAEKKSFLESISSGFSASVEVFSLIYVALFKLVASIFSGERLLSQISGPVGIFQATATASQLGIVYLLNFIGFISLNLAAINIFPFPALDGGRIVFLVLEKIKGSPVSVRVQQVVNGIGFALILLLILVVSVKDVSRLFS